MLSEMRPFVKKILFICSRIVKMNKPVSAINIQSAWAGVISFQQKMIEERER